METRHQGYFQLTETFAVTCKQKRQFSAERSEHPQATLTLSFGKSEMAACANTLYVCFFVA